MQAGDREVMQAGLALVRAIQTFKDEFKKAKVICEGKSEWWQ
jgi:hypothetical protein